MSGPCFCMSQSRPKVTRSRYKIHPTFTPDLLPCAHLINFSIQHIDVNSQCRDFKGVVQRKVTGQRQRAVQSPEYSRIYGEVIDSFHSTKHLKSWGDESLMLNIAHVLNVMYYVNDKSYSNAQIFWLIPLELVFPKVEDLTQDDYIIR